MTFDWGSSGTASSPGEWDAVNESFQALQQRILRQGQEIEAYILHTTESTEATRMLRSLFELFKSELSMNLNLRKSIISEKQQHNRALDGFLSRVAERAHRPLADLEEAWTYISDTARKYHNLKKEKLAFDEREAQLALELNEYKNRARDLHCKSKDMQQRLSCTESERLRLNNVTLDNYRLQNEVALLQAKVRDLTAELETQKKEGDAKAEKIACLERECADNVQLRQRVIDAEEVMEEQFKKNQALTSTNQSLADNLSTEREKNACIAEECSCLTKKTKELEAKLKEKNSYIHKIKAERNTSKKALDTLTNKCDCVEGKLSSISKELRAKNDTIDTLKKENHRLTREIMLIKEDVNTTDTTTDQSNDFQQEIESLALEISSLKEDLSRR